MYTVTIFRHGKKQESQFPYEWQAAQWAEIFLDCDPVLKGPDGHTIPLYSDSGSSEL